MPFVATSLPRAAVRLTIIFGVMLFVYLSDSMSAEDYAEFGGFGYRIYHAVFIVGIRCWLAY